MKNLGTSIFTILTQLMASIGISLITLLLVERLTTLTPETHSLAFLLCVSLVSFGFNILVLFIQNKRWQIYLNGVYFAALILVCYVMTYHWLSTLVISTLLMVVFALYNLLIVKFTTLYHKYPLIQTSSKIINIVAFVGNATLIVLFVAYQLTDGYASYYEKTTVYKEHNLYGLELEETNRHLTPPIYNEIGHFYEGLAAVRIGDKLGFIDRNGAQIIPCQFHNCQEANFNFIRFRFGLLPVCNEQGKIGIINHLGQWVYPAVCDSAKRMRDERYIKLYHDGCVGLFNGVTNSLLVPIAYDYICDDTNHFFALKNDHYTLYPVQK